MLFDDVSTACAWSREGKPHRVAELAEAQGKPVDIGGYYAADSDMTTSLTRPSKTLNAALAAVQG